MVKCLGPGATHYKAQLELQDKDRAIKELIVSWVLRYPITRMLNKKRYIVFLQFIYWGGVDLRNKDKASHQSKTYQN